MKHRRYRRDKSAPATAPVQLHEPAAIWSMVRVFFDRDIGLTQNIILAHAQSALMAVLFAIRELRKLYQLYPIKNAGVDPRIPKVLSDICFHAGVAATVLFNDSAKDNRESQAAFDLRRDRIKYVAALCAAAGLVAPTLRDRRVRNALTHIDEKLPDAVVAEPGVGWYVDFAVERRDEFVAPAGVRKTAFCRSYIRSEDCIVHLGQELSLQALIDECAALLAVVFGIDPRQIRDPDSIVPPKPPAQPRPHRSPARPASARVRTRRYG
jgi:hypothetical protein